MIGGIVNLVRYSIGSGLKTEGIHYQRFITHVKLFTERFFNNEMLKDENDAMFEQIATLYPERPIESMFKEEQVEIAFLPAPIDNTNFEAKFCTSHRHCLIIHKSNALAQKDFVTYDNLNDLYKIFT